LRADHRIGGSGVAVGGLKITFTNNADRTGMYRTTRWIELLNRPSTRVICCALVAMTLGAACADMTARADESLFAQPNRNAQEEQPHLASPPMKAVRQVTHVEAEPSRLTIPASETSLPLPSAPHSDIQKTSGGTHTLEALFSVIVSLGVVLGLFFLIAWLMRRGLPSTATARLPAEVVDVLGRAPLAGRQQMHLLRLGNKLLLVCVSPTGVDTLGEITDAAEADRLAALCRSAKATGSNIVAKSFQQVFARTGSDPLRTSLASAREAGNA
jgi:flagellar biogenesis protein FliO